MKSKTVDLSTYTIRPDLIFREKLLKKSLVDVETALFFGKLYKLNNVELGDLLRFLFNTDVINALLNEGECHSMELQDYLVELGYDQLIMDGEVTLGAQPPPAHVLPELWESLEIQIAASIQEVADQLGAVIGRMPGKEGKMLFNSLMQMNKRRPTIGDYRAQIQHARAGSNLVILDVSGSMTQRTIETIINEVVALSWKADAYLAIVSNHTTVWAPGSFSVVEVLRAAEYGGTHYETLNMLLEQDWDVVVTIADYDSSRDAKRVLAQCGGRINTVLDISLVGCPTYLAECVGQRADEVRPLLVSTGVM